jgi:catechol 2,3-dioxygenase-like lactoylglutathione lyase family enzyme
VVTDISESSVTVTAFDHVGIRVTDAKRALAFYEFGFEIDPDYSNDRVAEIVSRGAFASI